MRGVGPASDGDAVGGTAYWAAGLHLYSPLPLRPHWGGIGDLFRTHAFLTTGNIGDFAAPGQCHSHAHACTVVIFSVSVPPVDVHNYSTYKTCPHSDPACSEPVTQYMALCLQ